MSARRYHQHCCLPRAGRQQLPPTKPPTTDRRGSSRLARPRRRIRRRRVARARPPTRDLDAATMPTGTMTVTGARGAILPSRGPDEISANRAPRDPRASKAPPRAPRAARPSRRPSDRASPTTRRLPPQPPPRSRQGHRAPQRQGPQAGVRQGYVSAPALEPNGPSVPSHPPIARFVSPPVLTRTRPPPPPPASPLRRRSRAPRVQRQQAEAQDERARAGRGDQRAHLRRGVRVVRDAGAPAATPPRIREPSSLPFVPLSPRPSSLDRSFLTRPLPPPRLVPPLPSARATASCPRS